MLQKYCFFSLLKVNTLILSQHSILICIFRQQVFFSLYKFISKKLRFFIIIFLFRSFPNNYPVDNFVDKKIPSKSGAFTKYAVLLPYLFKFKSCVTPTDTEQRWRQENKGLGNLLPRMSSPRKGLSSPVAVPDQLKN